MPVDLGEGDPFGAESEVPDMSIKKPPASLASVLHDPYAYFETPHAVLDSLALTREDKERVLRAMEHEARELQVAAEENMTGGETRPLDDVLDALRQLNPDARPAGGGQSTGKP